MIPLGKWTLRVVAIRDDNADQLPALVVEELSESGTSERPLAAILRDHKERAFALGVARPEHLVFCTTTGGPLHQRNVTRRGLEHAVVEAGLVGGGRPRIRFHDSGTRSRAC